MIVEDKIHVFKGIYFYPPTTGGGKVLETLFEDMPKAQQYWRRQTDFPKAFHYYDPHLPAKKLCRLNASTTYYSGDTLVSLSVEDTQELKIFVEREIHRMRYGVWIMNNGVKIYFPGFYYGTLQHSKMIGVKGDGYGSHRRYQREFACQRQKVIEDPKLRAFYLHKIKKAGATQIISSFCAIETCTRRNQTKAFMSKNHDTAKSANFKYYSYALKTFPNVLLPSIETKGWKSAIQKIQIRSNDPELSLENIAVAIPTVADSADGLPPLTNIVYSEIAKYDDAETVLAKSMEQLQLQQTKVGIGEMECYPPENDGKSFRYCKKMYNVDCQDLDSDGYPKNKIIPLYIGLLEATDGTFDIYGEANKKLAAEMEMAERAKCDSPAKLQARKRQYHMTAKEGWEAGGGGSVYNNLILAAKKADLEEEYKNAQLNYRLGNLEWTGEKFNSPVRFVPLTLEEMRLGKKGRWKVFKDDTYIERNCNLCFKMPRKKKIINGDVFELLQPPTEVIHCGGTDPVDYGLISEMGKKRSTNASTVRDIMGDLCSTYFDRHENPDVDIENFAMQMIFWGSYDIVEGNRKNAVTSLEQLGLYYFILVKHPNGEIKPYQQSMVVKHVSSDRNLKALYIKLTSRAIVNNIEFFKDIDVIQDHMEIDPEATQEYDRAVSDSLCWTAVDALQTWVLSNKNRDSEYDFLEYTLRKAM